MRRSESRLDPPPLLSLPVDRLNGKQTNKQKKENKTRRKIDVMCERFLIVRVYFLPLGMDYPYCRVQLCLARTRCWPSGYRRMNAAGWEPSCMPVSSFAAILDSDLRGPSPPFAARILLRCCIAYHGPRMEPNVLAGCGRIDRSRDMPLFFSLSFFLSPVFLFLFFFLRFLVQQACPSYRAFANKSPLLARKPSGAKTTKNCERWRCVRS